MNVIGQPLRIVLAVGEPVPDDEVNGANIGDIDVKFDDVRLDVSPAVGSVPSADLQVAGLGEDDEETVGKYIRANFDHDEDNTGADGHHLTDIMPDAVAGDRINPADDDLQDASLVLDGRNMTGSFQLSYPSIIKVWAVDDLGTTVSGRIPSGQPQTITIGSDGPVTIHLKIEGIVKSDAPNDIDLGATFSVTGQETAEDHVSLTVSAVDVDVDSANQHGFEVVASNDDLAGWLEQQPNDPGKFVGVNDDDSDHNGSRDYLQGFGGGDGGTTTGIANERFTPVTLTLQRPFDLDVARLQFLYDGSDPEDPASSGIARLWLQNGDQYRPLETGGDPTNNFIHPGWTYAAADIGAASGSGVLWIEGMRPGTGTIQLLVDPDNEGPEGWSLYDQCRVTVVERTPTNLAATVTNGNTVNLSWTNGKDDLTRAYKIYRSTTANFTPSASNLVATLSGPVGGTPINTLADSPPSAGTYYYKVAAVDPAGTESRLSNTVAATTTSEGGADVVPPTITTPPAASSDPVAGTTTSVSVLGADDRGEAGLAYAWSVLSKPQGAADPIFSPNGTNAAKAATVTFFKSGNYSLVVTLSDGNNTTVSDPFSVTVEQVFSGLVVSPASVTVANGDSQTFSASAVDQFGFPLSTQSSISWSLVGAGTISTTSGQSTNYTAPATGSFSATVSATAEGPNGTIEGEATVSTGLAATVVFVSDDPEPDTVGETHPPDSQATFTFSRTDPNDTSDDLYVSFRFDAQAELNEAAPGVDFEGATRATGSTDTYQFVIPAGTTSANLVLSPLNDDFNTERKTIFLELLSAGKVAGVFSGVTGIPKIQITQQDGTVSSPPATIAGLNAALQAAVDSGNKVTELRITAHGASNLIELSNGELITAANGEVLDQNGLPLHPLMRQALAPNAVIRLQGCHTGSDDNWFGLNGGNNSVAAKMSAALPGVTVYGGKRWLARVAPNTVVGASRKFQDGQEVP